MTKADRTRQFLSLEQLNAIDLLVTGKSDREVAELTSVTRQTVCGWRLRDPHFQAELNQRRNEVWGASVDRLRNLLPKALGVLERELDGGENQFRAALRVVEMAGFAGRGRDLSSCGIGSEDAEEIAEIIESEARRRAERRQEKRAARAQQRAFKEISAAIRAFEEEEAEGSGTS